MGIALVPRMAAAGREGVVMCALGEDRPVRHVVAAVRSGSEEAAGGVEGAGSAEGRRGGTLTPGPTVQFT